jgi:predicted nucleic acid-binding protein
MERLATERVRIAVASPVLFEAYSLILRRSSVPNTLAWLGETITSVRITHPSAEDLMHASDRLRRFSDQSITLVDAVVAVMSEQLQIPVWTFDHHFDVMGANVWR